MGRATLRRRSSLELEGLYLPPENYWPRQFLRNIQFSMTAFEWTCLFSSNVSFWSESCTNASINFSVDKCNNTAGNGTNDTVMTTGRFCTPANEIDNKCGCLSFGDVQISYLVGGSLILLLLVVVIILSILLCCLVGVISRRSKRCKNKILEECTPINEPNTRNSNFNLEDSFDSIDIIEDAGSLDTVVNNKYDLIKLEKVASADDNNVDTVVPVICSSKKTAKKKPKPKKVDPGENKKKNAEYNRLSHGQDSKNPAGTDKDVSENPTKIDKDSYSVLDKPRRAVKENVEIFSKVKQQLPPPPQQSKSTNTANYEDVPKISSEAKRKDSSEDQSKAEKVYYNETAAILSQHVEAIDRDHSEPQERRVNIYTQSISL